MGLTELAAFRRLGGGGNATIINCHHRTACIILTNEIFSEVTMSNQSPADFSSFKTKLSPASLACFRVLLENVRQLLSGNQAKEQYEMPIADVLSLDGIDDVETVAKSIREILQCKIEVKVKEYQYFYPFFASVSIESGKIRYSVHREVEDAIALLPAAFYI